MPVTQLEWPILQHFFCTVEQATGMPPQPLDATPQQQLAQAQKNNDRDEDGQKPKQLPKGVVLGPDGKPCRSCTSFASWASMTKSQNPRKGPSSTSTFAAQSTPTLSQPPDCPPDVEELGRSTWTLLHTLTASYPTSPSLSQQSETRNFITLFGKMYPCWVCADDFRAWIKAGNEPRVSSREEFGRWMCEAHNAVNVKLGKNDFDCGRWEERWRTGWRDGRCD